MLDLIILGGSAAGCNAAIYAARRKLNFKLITDAFGGEVALSGEVNNWLGIQSIQGFDLAKNFADHVRSYGVDIEEGYRVEKITAEKKHLKVLAKNRRGETKEHATKTVIVATGIHPRELNVLGEKEFNRKGVTYCTVCDGPLFKNKITATIGCGNSALESALMMTGIAKKVYVLCKYADTKENNGGFPKGENILIDKVKSLPNVEIIYGAKTLEIIGDKMVTGLKYAGIDGQTKNLEVNGIMVHIGMTPNAEFVDLADKDKMGQIVVDAKCRASYPGIFAAGDVTNIPYKQIGIAAGQGITAALAAIEYINRWEE